MEKLKVFEKVSAILVASAALSFGQTAGVPYPPTHTAERQMISPGTVNYREGQVSLNNQALSSQGSVVMHNGETLTTGNGFAEVLLTPGAYLRVGPNSQTRLLTAGLANTRFALDRGIASVEVDQLIGGTQLDLSMNNGTIQIEKKGLYDFNADQQSVRVLDGKVNVEAAGGTKNIGKGDQLLLASAKPLKASGFDVKTEKAQPLYVWSEVRSQYESQANVAVAQNVAAYGGWYGAGWYFDPYWSSYAYLPGSGFLYSPFGWGFYSPSFIGYYGVPFGYGRYGHYYGALHGRVGGVNAHVGGFRGTGGGFRSAGAGHSGGRR